MSYLLVLLTIGLALTVHELGHFLAGRAAGIPIERFSVGFGPALLRRRWGATELRLGVLPLGGYVLARSTDPTDHLRRPLSARVAFILGGPFANLVASVLTLSLLASLRGDFGLRGLLVEPVVFTVRLLGALLAVIPRLFESGQQVSGVVGAVAAGGQAVGVDPLGMLRLFVVINLNLLVFNLLPLPPLDGGRLLLDLLQRFFPRVEKLYVPCVLAGWVFLVGLMVYTNGVDLARLLA